MPVTARTLALRSAILNQVDRPGATDVARDRRFSAPVLEAFARAKLPETLQVKAATADDPAEILLYQEIGWFGVTAADFMQALIQCGQGPVRVRINSPGGDVFDGLAIYNALKTRGGVECAIDGLAASAASFIAMAGETVTMAQHAMIMIHKAWGIVVGNAPEMLETAALLEKIDGELAAIYAAKAKQPVDGFAAAMTAETWYTGQEALEAGLVDKLTAGDDMSARAAAGVRAAAADWTCGAARDLPIDDADGWDGPAAAERLLDAAGFTGEHPDADKARRGFLVYDKGNPTLKGSYKLPFADMVGGELKAVAGGIDAAASRLPQTDVPQDVMDASRKLLDEYEARMKDRSAPEARILAVLKRAGRGDLVAPLGPKNAGRVLSAQNESQLRDAVALIEAVLAQVESTDDPEGDPDPDDALAAAARQREVAGLAAAYGVTL